MGNDNSVGFGGCVRLRCQDCNTTYHTVTASEWNRSGTSVNRPNVCCSYCYDGQSCRQQAHDNGSCVIFKCKKGGYSYARVDWAEWSKLGDRNIYAGYCMRHLDDRNAEARAREAEEARREAEEARRAAEAKTRKAEAKQRAAEEETRRTKTKAVETELTSLMGDFKQAEECVETLASQVREEESKIQHFGEERRDASMRNVILLGKTGSGKSTFANRLCGDCSQYGEEGPFTTGDGIDSETGEVQKESCTVAGQKFSFVDTPGMSDSQGRDRDHLNNITAFLRGSGGVNMFVFVATIANPRWDGKMREALDEFDRFFGSGFWEHTVIVLTSVEHDNRRKFEQVKSEIIKRITNHHWPGAHTIPVIGVGFERASYQQVVLDLAAMVREDRYMCAGLTSPIEELKEELATKQLRFKQVLDAVEKTLKRDGRFITGAYKEKIRSELSRVGRVVV